MSLTVEELPLVFSDITPIPQNDGPVCRIAYKPDFAEAHNYMRAILKADERSARALRLTQLCLQQNPANYTVWHFRRLCLDSVGLDLQQDLDMAASLGGSNPKNYQLWYHRRALLETVGLDSEKVNAELSYVGSVLEEDGKNYHAWSHRQWLLKTINSEDFWNSELDYSKFMAWFRLCVLLQEYS